MLRVTHIDQQSTVYRQLCRFEGALFRQWRQKWDSLPFEHRECCTHPVLVVSWLKNLSSRDSSKTELFVFYERDDFTCALPVKIFKKKVSFLTLYQLRIPFNPRLQQFGGSIAVEHQKLDLVLQALFRYFKMRKRTLCQINFPKVNETHFLVQSRLNKNCWHNGKRGLFKINGDSGAVFNRMSKRFRRNLNRIEKRLMRMPRVEFQSFEDEKDLTAAFERFVAVEASGWKTTERTAIKINRPLYEFYRDVAAQLSQSGNLFITLLTSDGQDLAGQFCLKYDNYLFMFKIGYNEAYKAVAPGLMLLKHTLAESDNVYGIDAINLISNDRWQKRWCPDIMNTFEVEIYPKTLLGFLVRLYCRLPKKSIRQHLSRLRL